MREHLPDSLRPPLRPPDLTALHGRHDCNLLAWLQFVIAIDEFHAYADQNALVVRPKGRLLRINFVQQIANSCSFRKIDILFTDSNQIAQLRVKMHSHFHPLGCSISSFRKTPM